MMLISVQLRHKCVYRRLVWFSNECNLSNLQKSSSVGAEVGELTGCGSLQESLTHELQQEAPEIRDITSCAKLL